MDIGRVRAVVSQMTLEEKARFLGCGLNLISPAADRLKVFGLKVPEELLCYKPDLSALGCSFDRELCKAYGEMRGNRARAEAELSDGAVNLGVIRRPMAKGSEKMFSEDPYVVTELSKAFIEGAGSVIGTNILSGEGVFCDRYFDARALREIYLRPFTDLAASLCGAAVPGGCLGGEVLSGSKNFMQLMSGVLPAGSFIVNEAGSVLQKSDSVNTGAAFEIGQSAQSVKAIAKEVENGRLSERRLDACVERTIHYIARRYEDLKKPHDKKTRADFDARAAAVTPVLLKNDGALPLGNGKSVYLTGDVDKTAAALMASDSLTTAKHIKDADAVLIFAKGEKGKLSASAVKTMHAAAESGKKTVLIICSPRPVETGDLLPANAVLFVPQIYFSTYTVLGKMLSGELSPSGKLPVSWAFSAGDYPAAKNERAAARGMFVWESVFNGYRYFNSFRQGVQFPFGHGLSYSEFEYSKLKVSAGADAFEIEFVVKNIGHTAAETVAFVFCDLADASLYGLKSRLTAFARVQLDKGENTRVFLKIPYDRISVYCTDTDAFAAAGGKYDIKICKTAEDVALVASVKIPKPSRIKTGLDSKKIPGYYSSVRLSPLGTEIETVVGVPLIQKRNEYADYLMPPEEKKKAGFEKAVFKKMKKALKSDPNPDFTGMSGFGFLKLLDSE